MATWGRPEIKAAYIEGERQGASHMLVAWDSFDGDNYPIYVRPGTDPKTKKPSNGDRVDECYRYSLGWDVQSMERRAFHWEWEPEHIPKAIDTPFGQPAALRLRDAGLGDLRFLTNLTSTQLRAAVEALMDCEHAHNFVVKKDGWEIGTSTLGLECIDRAFLDHGLDVL